MYGGVSILQTTPDGRRKIVDLVDCTGSGDVDTSTVCKTDGVTGREIEGLTGRKLQVCVCVCVCVYVCV